MPAWASERAFDGAVSDVVGTIVLVGVAVSVVAAIGVLVAPPSEEEAPRLSARARAASGATTLDLVHASGSELTRGDLRAVVSVGGRVLHDGTIGGGSTPWKIGEVVAIPLSAALVAGDQVDVDVASDRHGVLVSTRLIVGGVLATPPPPTFGVLAGATPTNVSAPAPLVVTANLTHSGGRQAVMRVSANLSAIDGERAIMLVDDGTRGDLVASDGVFTATALVPPSAALGSHVIRLNAVDIDGNEATGTVNVSVVSNATSGASGAKSPHDTLVYNESRIQRLVVRVLKYASSSNPDMTTDDDRVTVHVKVDLQSDPFPVGTKNYTLARAWFDHAMFDDDNDAIRIDQSAIDSNDKWYRCENTTHKIKLFMTENETIDEYSKVRHPLHYYVALEYKEVGGSTIQREYIQSAGFDKNMIMTRDQDVEVLTSADGWSPSLQDCSP